MDIRHKIDIGFGIGSIMVSLFVKEFSPIGWTTHLIWGGGKDARIPRPIAAAFYFVLGVLLLYRGIFK